MAIFGTPTVIGTLTSATSQTQYTVPITASTSLSDSIIVIAGSNGGGVNGIPSSITDGTGLINFQMYQSTPGVGQLTYWQIFNTRAFSNTDTILVNYPTANTNLKNIIVLDCPGVAPSPQALDQASLAINNSTLSGNGSTITVNSNLSYNYELVIFATQDSNTGGSPTGFGSFTVPTNGIQHSGSGEYTSVSYQIVNGGVGPITASCTLGASSTWSGLVVGMVANIPIYNTQFPFPSAVAFPTIAFNPALSALRPQHSQVPVPTVISSASASVTGAQTVVYANGVNSLKGDASSFNASVGNWTNGGNTTQAQTNAVSHNAQGALQATATGSGTLNLLSATAGKITTTGMAVNPGDSIFVGGWILAAATPRTVQIGVSFLDSNANVLGTNFVSPSIVDSTSVWTFVSGIVTTGAFTTSAWGRVSVQWSSVAGSEVHYISDMWMFDITSGSGMGEQIQIFTPSNQQFQLQPAGIPYPLSLNNSLQFLPRQQQTAPFAVFQPGTTGTVAVSAPSGSPTTFQTFQPQFPFQPQLPPFSLQLVSPAMSWLRPQYNTGNTFVYIDGGAGGQVTVNANFPDINIIVSVSATTNVSVTAPSPPIVVTGVTANVNVVSINGSIVETLAGSVSSVNVAGISGAISESLSGTVANAAVQARAGIVTVTPTASVSSNVNVSIAGDNVTVITLGTVANVSVATAAKTTDSMIGVTANVNVAAVAGSMSVTMVGVAASVTVASTEGVTVSVTGVAANVSVAAIAGTPGKTVSVPSANVSVTAVAGSISAASTISSVAAIVTVSAISGSVSRSLQGSTANVTVVANSGLDGTITISGFLVNPDLAEDILISDKGKLLSVPVKNMLVSATTSPQPQGI